MEPHPGPGVRGRGRRCRCRRGAVGAAAVGEGLWRGEVAAGRGPYVREGRGDDSEVGEDPISHHLRRAGSYRQEL